MVHFAYDAHLIAGAAVSASSPLCPGMHILTPRLIGQIVQTVMGGVKMNHR